MCIRPVGTGCGTRSDMFPLPVFGGGENMPPDQPIPVLLDIAADFSIGEVGEAPLALQLDLNDACTSISCLAANSGRSTGRDDQTTLRHRLGQRGNSFVRNWHYFDAATTAFVAVPCKDAISLIEMHR